jgi:hypothetical protein
VALAKAEPALPVAVIDLVAEHALRWFNSVNQAVIVAEQQMRLDVSNVQTSGKPHIERAWRP